MKKSLSLLALTALLLTACASAPPTPLAPPYIIGVKAWGGTLDASPPAQPQKISQITLHHQGETFVPGTDVPTYLKRLQTWSRLSKRWADIPYHWVIAPDGKIYAARDPGVSGDTNTEYKPAGHALVMVLGNFEEVEPNAAQLRAVVELMAWIAQSNGLSVETIASHKDYAKTLCPGKNLYRYIENGWIKRAVAARLAGQPEPPI